MKHTIHVKKLNINENINKQLREALSWLHEDSLQTWKTTQFTKHKQEKSKSLCSARKWNMKKGGCESTWNC